MRTTPRPTTRLAIVTAVAGGALLAGSSTAHAAPGEQDTPTPQVTLEVQPAEDGEGHSWQATFEGAHLQPADGSPHIEWLVDTYAPESGPRPVTVAAGAEADPHCEPGTQVHQQDTLTAERTDLTVNPIPRGTDRVMVYGSYCAADGSVHRFEVENDLRIGPAGRVVVDSYPLLDDRVREEDPRPRGDGPIIDTGLAATTGGAAAPWAAGLAGVGLLGAGATTLARRQRA